MNDTVYIVFQPARYWPRRPVARKLTRRKPKLREGEVAIRLELEIPETIFNPPTFPVRVTEQNVIRPDVKVKQS